MKNAIAHIALLVRDDDEAIAYYTPTLGFTLVENTYQPEQDKRWVIVAPAGSHGTTLRLARASTPVASRSLLTNFLGPGGRCHHGGWDLRGKGHTPVQRPDTLMDAARATGV